MVKVGTITLKHLVLYCVSYNTFEIRIGLEILHLVLMFSTISDICVCAKKRDLGIKKLLQVFNASHILVI